MSTHPILIRNLLQAGPGSREVLVIFQGRVVPASPALLSAGPFSDDGKGGLIAPATTLGGGAGYLAAAGHWVVAPELEGAYPFHDGLAPYCKDGLYGYVHPDGSTAIAPRWTGAQHFYDGLAAVLVAPDTWRYIDKRGEYAFDGEFCEAGAFREHGLAAARIGKGDPAGYLDKQGGWAIAPRFVTALRFCADGAAPVSVGEKQFGLIDVTGAWIVQPKYRYIENFNADGLAFFAHGKESWGNDTGFLDARGQTSFAGAWEGRENMVDGVIRDGDYFYEAAYGKFHVDGMDWGGEINQHNFAIGRTSPGAEAGSTAPATWGIMDMEEQFVSVPANALEPLTDSSGMLVEPEAGTPLVVFIGDDDDLLMLDRSARIAYRLRRESCAEGQYAALYDADARLLWTSAVGGPIVLPERFFVAPPHTLMDQLSSPEALIDFAKAMLVDTEHKLQRFACEGQVDEAGDDEDDDKDRDTASRLASRSRIVRFYLNEELVGYYQFLAEERRALLQRIEEDCVARLSAQFGPPDKKPDFAGKPNNIWYKAWPFSLETPLPGAGDAPEANRLWLALNWSGDTGDGDEWGELWLTCAPSLETLEVALEAYGKLTGETQDGTGKDVEDEEEEEEEEEEDDPAHMSREDLLALVAGEPDAISELDDEQIDAGLADAATDAHAGALEYLPERFQTPQRLEALIRKSLDCAMDIPDVCMSAQGLALARSLYGDDDSWSAHDAERCTPRTGWDQDALSDYWGALVDAAMSERALRAGVSLYTIPLWLRTPELEALALELDIANIDTVRKQAITADIAARAVRERNAALLQYIPSDLITPALCLASVQHDGETLAFVPPALRSVEVCTAAVTDNVGALYWVPEEMEEDICTRVIEADLAAGVHDTWAANQRGQRYTQRALVRTWNDDYAGAADDAAVALRYLEFPVDAHYLLALCYRALGRPFDSALEAATVLAIDKRYKPDWEEDTAWLSPEAKATLAKADDEALLRGLRSHPLALSKIAQRRITQAMAEVAVAASPDALEFVPKKLLTPELQALAAR
ncbi:WG repeat-containing protein [Massilia violaceinigra]|uniref:WG repeat-containing protein n=1 Tax=Massilia violaceinigra TaxID=2045208 RepID=A0ABY4A5N4_9BURK|nr:WG repeat-containing protein [Massilia violaceinigra]UOD30095.1 WG repeat-containing protein [Massilia violaceinigra]